MTQKTDTYKVEFSLARQIEPPEVARLNFAFEALCKAAGLVRGVSLEAVPAAADKTGRWLYRITMESKVYDA